MTRKKEFKGVVTVDQFLDHLRANRADYPRAKFAGRMSKSLYYRVMNEPGTVVSLDTLRHLAGVVGAEVLIGIRANPPPPESKI